MSGNFKGKVIAALVGGGIALFVKPLYLPLEGLFGFMNFPGCAALNSWITITSRHRLSSARKVISNYQIAQGAITAHHDLANQNAAFADDLRERVLFIKQRDEFPSGDKIYFSNTCENVNPEAEETYEASLKEMLNYPLDGVQDRLSEFTSVASLVEYHQFAMSCRSRFDEVSEDTAASYSKIANVYSRLSKINREEAFQYSSSITDLRGYEEAKLRVEAVRELPDACQRFFSEDM